MDIYHIWCDLKPGVQDLAFCKDVDAYLGRLREAGKIEGYRITRAKLGLGARGEFHIMIEVTGLAQLDEAFTAAAARAGPVEGLHAAVNQKVANPSFALYRDFPDAERRTGEEAF